MKKLVLLHAAILFTGCGEKKSTPETLTTPSQPEPLVDKALSDFDAIPALAATLEETIEEGPEGNFIVKGTDTLYSGVFYKVDSISGEEVYIVANIKDGQFEGPSIMYRSNGSKAGEVKLQNGTPVEGSEQYWNSKGQKVDTQEEALHSQ
ncbi:MAG: hypothetical protein ABGZ31_02095 [Roseibacillus sp.]